MRNLCINLHEENQVDFVLRNLDKLVILNNLAIEKELLVDSTISDNNENGK